ncbi:MAG: hypothetical protein K9N55_20440 [Phycisphaerae bacterium]|nr:hypothetical protein [Phycisphaerae bacterium]
MVRQFLCLCVVLCQTAGAVESLAPQTQWIPDNAVLCVELSNPKALIDMLTSDTAFGALQKVPLYQTRNTNPKFKEFLTGVKFLEAALETSWKTAIRKLTGGGITLAVCPDDLVILMVDAEDADLLTRLHNIVLTMVRTEADNQGHSDRVASAEYLGVTGWSFDGKEAHAIIGHRLIFANKPEALKTVLELRARADKVGLASQVRYRAAREATAPDAAGQVYADLATLKQIPDLAAALEQGRANPLAGLLFAGIIESIRDATWMSVGLHVQHDTLAFRAHLDSANLDPKGPAGFALPGKPNEGALPNLSVPGGIASLSFYRDLFRFYGAKDDLFPERTSGLIFFENMMGIFFSGRDLTDEVLAETLPEIRFVVAQQQYDPALGTPQVQIPAFGLILRLRDEQTFDIVAEEAWQKAVGLVNFTRGQQGMPGLIIDRPVHNDTKFTMAYFSTATVDKDTNLPTRFNIRPAIALPHNYLILSSTDGLARDLIDAVTREAQQAVQPANQDHTLAELNGQALTAILRANVRAMVTQNMVEKGNTEEEAKNSIDLLITLAQFVDSVKLSIGTHQSLTRAELALKFNLD